MHSPDLPSSTGSTRLVANLLSFPFDNRVGVTDGLYRILLQIAFCIGQRTFWMPDMSAEEGRSQGRATGNASFRGVRVEATAVPAPDLDRGLLSEIHYAFCVSSEDAVSHRDKDDSEDYQT